MTELQQRIEQGRALIVAQVQEKCDRQEQGVVLFFVHLLFDILLHVAGPRA